MRRKVASSGSNVSLWWHCGGRMWLASGCHVAAKWHTSGIKWHTSGIQVALSGIGIPLPLTLECHIRILVVYLIIIRKPLLLKRLPQSGLARVRRRITKCMRNTVGFTFSDVHRHSALPQFYRIVAG